MEYSNVAASKQNSKEPPFSAEDWQHTPPSIRLFILSMMARIRMLETEVVSLTRKSEPQFPKLDPTLPPQ